jgi:Uma2 family endonuclease
MAVQGEKKHFTVEEYRRMAEAGIFAEDDRVELIEGEVFRTSPIGSRHAASVKRLNRLLNQLAGREALVGVQDPIVLDDFSEPEPDIALLKPRKDFYAQEHPTAQDVLLIIEIADTSSQHDRGVKLPAYARSGIPEVWIADLSADAVECHAEPANGAYRNTRSYKRGEMIIFRPLPNVAVEVEQILGPPGRG